jgi:hypothetical protein
MARVIVTAEVQDARKWEDGFRAKGKLFEKMTQRVAHYCVTDENTVAIYEEVDDLDQYMAVLQSAEAAEAMASDGVKAETVRFFVLDKTFET